MSDTIEACATAYKGRKGGNRLSAARVLLPVCGGSLLCVGGGFSCVCGTGYGVLRGWSIVPRLLDVAGKDYGLGVLFV